MRVNPETAPEAYGRLKARWLTLVNCAPDPQLVRGAAAFVAAESLDEGKRLLKAAIARKPDDTGLWLDLGRMSKDASERLMAFQRARDAGETLPNLLAWIATSSFEAGEYEKAERTARELIRLVDDARVRYGGKLDWPERGPALWRRAREVCANDADAGELTDAIAQHAYRKHWANTVFGLLACRNGDLNRAASYLRASATYVPNTGSRRTDRRWTLYARSAWVADGRTDSITSESGRRPGTTHASANGSRPSKNADCRTRTGPRNHSAPRLRVSAVRILHRV
jgi:hypothetical protein